MLTVAKHAVMEHPKLEKVVVMEHAPRDDPLQVDPTGIKAILAEYANFSLHQLVQQSDFKDKIEVGRHVLDSGKIKKDTMFRDEWSGYRDGVHMYGSQGKQAFTDSLCQIVRSVCPSKRLDVLSTSTYHKTCPQARYQQRKSEKQTQIKGHYNVPIHNRFDVLGN